MPLNPSHSDVVKSKDVLKSFIFKNLSGYKVEPVQGDGLCTFHSFTRCLFSLRGFQIPTDELHSTLKSYLLKNFNTYSEFTEENINIVDELDKLFKNPLGNYNENISDLYLKALGDAYEVNIVLFQSNAETCWILDLSNYNNPHPDTLYFARSLSPHVDPIVPYLQTQV